MLLIGLDVSQMLNEGSDLSLQSCVQGDVSAVSSWWQAISEVSTHARRLQIDSVPRPCYIEGTWAQRTLLFSILAMRDNVLAHAALAKCK